MRRVTLCIDPISKFRNKYFEIPFDVSPYFTGGDDVCCELRKDCLPSENFPARVPQKRFILYGLGGSGKTQMALKFASDHRERCEDFVTLLCKENGFADPC